MRTTLPRMFVPVLAAGLLAAACGSDDDEGTLRPADQSTAFPVTIEHAYGTTEIIEQPTTVVSVGYNDQDPILALGVVPVGVMQWYQDHPRGFFWTEERYGDTRPALVNGAQFLEINFEQVARLEPDLIVGVSGLTEDAYQTLSQIAPTLAQPPGEGDYSSAPWQDAQRMIGAALGLSDQAEEVIGEVEDTVATARAAHPEFEGATALVAQVDGGQYAVRGYDEVWSKFLLDLGFEIPSDLASADFTEVSEELVERFGDLDVLVWLATPDEVDSLLYSALPVAQEGRAVHVEAVGELSGAIGFNSALSLPIVVERLVPLLAAAIDGDPATEVAVAG